MINAIAIAAFVMCWVVEKLTRLEGCGMKHVYLMFKTNMFVYQSRANLDAKILFFKVIHF